MGRESKTIDPSTVRSHEWITVARPADVLFGRGTASNEHDGNIDFRTLVASRKAEYDSAVIRRTKAKIAQEIVESVWRNGGRFIKRIDNADCWVEVDPDVAMEKAKQALRQHREKATVPCTKTTSPLPVPDLVPVPHVSDVITVPRAHQMSTRDVSLSFPTGCSALKSAYLEFRDPSDETWGKQFHSVHCVTPSGSEDGEHTSVSAPVACIKLERDLPQSREKPQTATAERLSPVSIISVNRELSSDAELVQASATHSCPNVAAGPCLPDLSCTHVSERVPLSQHLIPPADSHVSQPVLVEAIENFGAGNHILARNIAAGKEALHNSSTDSDSLENDHPSRAPADRRVSLQISDLELYRNEEIAVHDSSMESMMASVLRIGESESTCDWQVRLQNETSVSFSVLTGSGGSFMSGISLDPNESLEHVFD